MSGKHPTLEEKLRIGRFLDTVIEKIEDGFVAYKDDWTDQKVSDHLGVTLPGAVQSVRVRGYGKFRTFQKRSNGHAGPADIEPATKADIERLIQLLDSHGRMQTARTDFLLGQVNDLRIALGEKRVHWPSGLKIEADLPNGLDPEAVALLREWGD